MKLNFVLSLILSMTLNIWIPISSQADPISDPVARLKEIDVLNYRFILDVRKTSNPNVTISERITLKALSVLQEIPLHFSSERTTILSISRVAHCPNDFTSACHENFPLQHRIEITPENGKVSRSVIHIRLQSPLAQGKKISLEVKYDLKTVNVTPPNRPKDDVGGLLRTELSPSSREILNTQSWPYFAREWAFLNDHPTDPATMETVFLLRPEVTAYANGRQILKRENLSVWKTDLPLQTYGMNFTIGQFESFKIENGVIDPFILWSRDFGTDIEPFKSELLKVTKAFNLYSKIFGTYAYEKLGFARVPHPYNMESPSLITIVRTDAMIHELAHHWWGNTVRMKEWNDFWISEGFTTYFTGYFDEVNSGKNTAIFQTTGILRPKGPVDPLSIFDLTPYQKGAAAIDGLRTEISKLAKLEKGSALERKLFETIFGDLWKKYAFQNITSEQIRDSIQAELKPTLARFGISTDSASVRLLMNSWWVQWIE